MTRKTLDVRRGMLIALSAVFVATAASAEDAKVTGEVTVQAERPTAKVVGRSASGMPIVLSSVQYRVSYSDLDLSIPSNAKVLSTRVRDAARAACADLNKLYSLGASGADGCWQQAEERAKPQMLSAIAAAEARKTASD